MLPSVSIVIPAHKATFFAEALASACLQASSIPCEVLVGDDSGSAEIENICRSMKEQFPAPIKYFKNKIPLGEVGNLKNLINAASADIIKPLYDDDVLAPNAVFEMVTALLQSPNVAFVTTNRATINEESLLIEAPHELAYNKICEQKALVSGLSALKVLATRAVNFIGEPSCVCFRKDRFIGLGDSFNLINENIFTGLGDLTIWVNLIGSSFDDFVYLPQTLAFHRLHTGSQTDKVESFGVDFSDEFSLEIMRHFGVDPFPTEKNLLDRLEKKLLF